MSPKFYFAFYACIDSKFKNLSIYLKKRPNKKLRFFWYQILTSVERWDKELKGKANCSSFF